MLGSAPGAEGEANGKQSPSVRRGREQPAKNTGWRSWHGAGTGGGEWLSQPGPLPSWKPRSLLPSPTWVVTEKGILPQRMDGADGTNTHHSQKSRRYLGEAGAAAEPTKLQPVNAKCFRNVLGSGCDHLLLLLGSTGVTGMGWAAPQQHGAIQVLHPWGAGNLREGKSTVFLQEDGREAAPACSVVLLGCGSCSIFLLSFQVHGNGFQAQILTWF